MYWYHWALMSPSHATSEARIYGPKKQVNQEGTQPVSQLGLLEPA